MSLGTINIVGAGILGLWQAYTLSKAGFFIRLFERSDEPFQTASSRLAGAMLAPYCESEASQKDFIPFAERSMVLWQDSPFEISQNGTLVVAPQRDKAELTAFAKRTISHRLIQSDEIAELEPDLKGQFQQALYFEGEGHLAPRPLMAKMLAQIQKAGAEIQFGWDAELPEADVTIDTSGMAAAKRLQKLQRNLRPVRGEMAVVRLEEVQLKRPVRMLHPRMPCYIVPWPDHHYMIGATVIESDDSGPVSVRAGLELLGAAYTVHPAFGEAKIIELNAGVRPSLSDNLPKVIVDEGTIYVNGAFRHGFLMAPLLAQIVADYVKGGQEIEDYFQ